MSNNIKTLVQTCIFIYCPCKNNM